MLCKHTCGECGNGVDIPWLCDTCQEKQAEELGWSKEDELKDKALAALDEIIKHSVEGKGVLLGGVSLVATHLIEKAKALREGGECDA